MKITYENDYAFEIKKQFSLIFYTINKKKNEVTKKKESIYTTLNFCAFEIFFFF